MEEELKKEIKRLKIKNEEYEQQLWDLVMRLIDIGYCDLDSIKEQWDCVYNFCDWLDED